MHMLSVRINSWCVCSVHASVPACTLSARISSLRTCSACLKGPFQFGIFGFMLSIRVRNWWICSGYASVPGPYAQGTHQFLTCMLRVRISSWPVCSGYASVHDAYAQHVLRGLRSVHALVPDVYAQCTNQFLTRMLSVCISSYRACS